MQWVAPIDPARFSVCRPDRLPTSITMSTSRAFAVRASDHDTIDLDVDGPSAFLVLGPRRSGRTTALRRWAESWSACRPGAEVHWIESVEDWRNATGENELARLLVVDDSVSVWQRLTSNDIDEVSRRGHHLLAAATPSALRARPDHPLHTLRRHRSGLVLGSSAHTDVDLFGVFDIDPPFVEPAVGRGWYVDRGEVIDLVQVVRPTEGAP